MKTLEIDETTPNAIQSVTAGLSFVLDRVFIVLLVLTLLVAIWWYSQMTAVRVPAGQWLFDTCPAISAHC